MARIPTYQDRLTPNAFQTQQASAPRIEDNTGLALQNLGKELQAAAEQMRRAEEQREIDEIAKAEANERLYWLERGQELDGKTQAGGLIAKPDGTSQRLVEAVGEEFTERRKQFLANVQSPRARAFAERAMTNLQIGVMTTAMKAQERALHAGRLVALDEVRSNAYAAIQRGADPASVTGSVMSHLANSGLDPVTQANVAIEFKKHAAEFAMGRLAQQSPARAGALMLNRLGAGEGQHLVLAMPEPERVALEEAAGRLGVGAGALAIAMHYESGMNPKRWGGKGGAYLGLIQINPDDQKKYGITDKQTFLEQLPGVEKWLKDHGVRPGDDLTTIYRVINGGNRNAPLTASDGNGTIADHLRNMQTRFGGSPGDVRPNATEAYILQHLPPERIIPYLNQARQFQEQELAKVRAEINRKRQDHLAALLDGKESHAITAEQINSAGYARDEAAQMIREMNVARDAGRALASVKHGRPEDIAAMLSRMEGEQQNGEDIEAYRYRQSVVDTVKKALVDRQRRISDDPAAYFADSPLLQFVQSGEDTPDKEQRIAAALLEQQRIAGVPDSKQRILPNARVSSIVEAVRTTPAQKGPIQPAFEELQKRFGPFWRKAFGELVQHGGLPRSMQVLMQMDRADQTEARVALQNIQVAAMAHQKGLDGYREDAYKNRPDIKRDAVRDAIDGRLNRAFRAFAIHGEAGKELFNTIRATAELLSLHYMTGANKDSVSDAARTALDNILYKKWDFDDVSMFPAGMLTEITRAKGHVKLNLDPERVEPLRWPGVLASASDLAKTAQWKDALASRTKWIVNHDSTGLVLNLITYEGAAMPLVDKNTGKPVTILFDALPTIPEKPKNVLEPAGPARYDPTLQRPQ